MCIRCSVVISLFYRFISSSKLDADGLTANLLSSMYRLETVEPTEYTSVLQDCLVHHKITVPKLQNQVSHLSFWLIWLAIFSL